MFSILAVAARKRHISVAVRLFPRHYRSAPVSVSAQTHFDVKDIVSCVHISLAYCVSVAADCAHQQPLIVRTRVARFFASLVPMCFSFCFNLYPFLQQLYSLFSLLLQRSISAHTTVV